MSHRFAVSCVKADLITVSPCFGFFIKENASTANHIFCFLNYNACVNFVTSLAMEYRVVWLVYSYMVHVLFFWCRYELKEKW